MNEWLAFFTSVHTSKGIYRQPKFNIDSFLESGEGNYAVSKPKPIQTFEDNIVRSFTPDANVCDKSEDPTFIEKLNEALGFLKAGLPPGATLKIAINYAVNLIKKTEGKEELWFQAVSFEDSVLAAKLAHTPQKVKYQKEGSIIKPSLDKIEKFYFEEETK